MNKEKIRQTCESLIRQGRDGFTLDINGNEHTPSSGYAVALLTFTNIETALQLIGKDCHYFGFWSHEGKQYFAIVEIFQSSFVAFAFALATNQKAIYNFSNDEVINVGDF